MEQRFPWKIEHLREHTAVLDGSLAPTKLLINATYLNSSLKMWKKGHIWIYCNRIVYVGDKLPENTKNTEITDLTDKWVVPGYIEPHVHPFQLYNPQSFAEYASQSGTTTFISDNLMMLLLNNKKKALPFIQQFKKSSLSFYWWARLDAQTEISNEQELFTNGEIRQWLADPSVLLAGELTSWPKLADGDDMILSWMQEARIQYKRVEGHLPGASEKTIAKMTLLGVTGDHEAMTGDEAWTRLEQGLAVTLRHSSIRPDLPKLIQELKEKGLQSFDSLMMTTDGSTPSFYRDGVMDRLIQIALDSGVDPIEAYHMATYSIAKYYRLEFMQGMIATGRQATLNVLSSADCPTPESVLSKGQWVKKEGERTPFIEQPDWSLIPPLELEWELTDEDLQFSMPFGIEMVNNVITKPYSINSDTSVDELHRESDESFLMLIDRNGKWKICTVIKGFVQNLGAIGSSFSNTGDLLFIGKSKKDIQTAFSRIQNLQGGIVLVDKGEVLHEIPLTIGGIMSREPMEIVMNAEETLREIVRERGYSHGDPVYTLLFLSSTHLPYVRITQKGLYDVKKKTVLFPTIMR
ncbi:adenine deaminase C-terminal domain-containing protein [Jeotgalibacillus sp. ET6]|uniref:adenine deaminase C-terminal domain-containing protein n=1 Tax=Jeotgalibacillus sp. ET6 TaxID=3037260 RepID=UPI0024181F34|nr:adenine deaminase C-terminal domain-containing protein [Jeotgalibacillus sp. ET6]MDG5473598.1 adenine deaminase C-terminal domain-containing protein [Jeotgalibacillus sp. ET6]